MKKWRKVVTMAVLGLGMTVVSSLNEASAIEMSPQVPFSEASGDAVVPVTGISLNLEEITLEAGRNRMLGVNFEPRNATDKGVTWSSTDKTVADVTAKGMVVAKKAGTVAIVAKTKDGGKIAVSTVTVNAAVVVPPASVTGIKMNIEKFKLARGRNRMLAVLYTPELVTNEKIYWSSANPNIAAVTSTGMVMAKGIGETTIHARTVDGNHMASSKVIVTP